MVWRIPIPTYYYFLHSGLIDPQNTVLYLLLLLAIALPLYFVMWACDWALLDGQGFIYFVKMTYVFTIYLVKWENVCFNGKKSKLRKFEWQRLIRWLFREMYSIHFTHQWSCSTMLFGRQLLILVFGSYNYSLTFIDRSSTDKKRSNTRMSNYRSNSIVEHDHMINHFHLNFRNFDFFPLKTYNFLLY